MQMRIIRIRRGPAGSFYNVIYLQRHLFTTCFGAGSVNLNTNLNENDLTPAVPPIVTGGLKGSGHTVKVSSYRALVVQHRSYL